MRGVREITRAPLFDPTRVMGAAKRALSSPKLVRVGAVALILAGAIGLTADAFLLYETYRMSTGSYTYTAENPLVSLFFILQWTLGWVLLTLGLFGLNALLSGAAALPRRLALAGAALALGTVAPVLWEAVWLWLPQRSYYPLLAFLYYVLPTGILLSGMAALWARGLGRWRFLVPLVCLLGTPLMSGVLYYVFEPYYGDAMMVETDFKMGLLMASPRVTADAGLLLFGLALFGARERETRLLAKERRETETRNLAAARELYEEACTKADLSLVDELVSPDVFDHRRERRGRAEFKRAIADLHRTFPDLILSVEEQTAEGDTVKTRCTFSGTDRGGVLWYPPTGNRAGFTVTFLDRFSDGRLIEHRGESDTAGLLHQLGLPQKEG